MDPPERGPSLTANPDTSLTANPCAKEPPVHLVSEIVDEAIENILAQPAQMCPETSALEVESKTSSLRCNGTASKESIVPADELQQALSGATCLEPGMKALTKGAGRTRLISESLTFRVGQVIRPILVINSWQTCASSCK